MKIKTLLLAITLCFVTSFVITSCNNDENESFVYHSSSDLEKESNNSSPNNNVSDENHEDGLGWL